MTALLVRLDVYADLIVREEGSYLDWLGWLVFSREAQQLGRQPERARGAGAGCGNLEQ